MRLILEVWRQESPAVKGRFEVYEVDDAREEMSLLELLDRLNHQLVEQDQDPVAFESDCREGICG
ncbi:MAG: succinate dehydrogenase/fumarate reductase iron-sulfur subunit, partial [Bifidobacteriaceae bacterium]|nr:succinate dehydrogenase/fumarate reductase iron-sulfur subunit [Bifidobacteriaceae bacterium]